MSAVTFLLGRSMALTFHLNHRQLTTWWKSSLEAIGWAEPLQSILEVQQSP